LESGHLQVVLEGKDCDGESGIELAQDCH